MREISALRRTLSLPDAGERMYGFVSELYPICRSLTGDGVRKTLAMIRARIPVETREVPSGTRVFDWTIPKEWNITEAWIKAPGGRRVVDFAESNLHVVGYSMPVHATVTLAQLKQHLFTLPERPHWIPYRTSYFNDEWGFCMSHSRMMALEEGSYEVRIDSSLSDGAMSYGEFLLEGESPDEVLISTHVCHPSLCNDNLSGIAVATELAAQLRSVRRRYSYRFLFIPATLGSIAWLALNEEAARGIRHGLVLAGVGDAGRVTYKQSRRGDSEIDRAATYVLRTSGQDCQITPFVPYGYDERQYCSPGFDLPVGVLMRTPHGRYAEYHTSADDLSFVQPAFLADSLHKCVAVLSVLENDGVYVSRNPLCEPQLGRRGLYRSYGERGGEPDREMALLWVLNLADGNHSLLDIAERSSIGFEAVRLAADILIEHGLLEERPDNEHPESRGRA